MQELHSKEVKEAEKLLNYLGIKNSASSHKLHQAFAQAKVTSVGGWQRELSEEQLQQITQESGSLLQQLGYSQ